MYFSGFILVQKLWLYIFGEEQDFSHFIFIAEAFEKSGYSKNISASGKIIELTRKESFNLPLFPYIFRDCHFSYLSLFDD